MVDLGPTGSLVGAALALVGLGVVGVPISIIFDGYAEISEDYAERYLEVEEAAAEDELVAVSAPAEE